MARSPCARTQVLANTLAHTYTLPAVLSVLCSEEDDAYGVWLHNQMIQQWNCSVSYDPSLGTIQAAYYINHWNSRTAGHSGPTCFPVLCMKCGILSAHLPLTRYVWPLASVQLYKKRSWQLWQCQSSVMRYKTSVQRANHMMDAQKDDGEGDEPTLVMGASIVMEWIRAIEECLRCELPDRMKRTKKQVITQQQIKQQFSQTLSNECVCVYVQSTLDAKRQLGRFHKVTRNAQSFHYLSPFTLTIAPPRCCGSYVQRAFPPVFVLTGLDVWGEKKHLTLTRKHKHNSSFVTRLTLAPIAICLAKGWDARISQSTIVWLIQ